MKHLVLIGPPGSGKGTLSLELIKKGFNHISTGDLLREEIASGSELGKYIASLIDKGNMVDDNTSLAVMKKAMQSSKVGVIFDGYPRNLSQAKLLEDVLLNNDTSNLYIIYLSMPLELLAERIIHRYTCPSCGEIYHLKTKAPLKEGDNYTCPQDHTVLSKRKDDNLESLKTRFEVFKANTVPVVESYRNYERFFEIDATKKPEEILEESLKILGLN